MVEKYLESLELSDAESGTLGAMISERRLLLKRLVGSLDRMGLVSPDRGYEAGRSIFLQDSHGDGLYLLKSGMARLSRTYSNGKRATLRIVGEWEVFGDFAPGASGDSVVQEADAEAMTDCRVVKLPRLFIERATGNSHETSTTLNALLGLELAYRTRLLGYLLPRATEARLAVLLPILALQLGASDGEEDGMLLPRLTHQDLAEITAATRESVTSSLMELRRRGLIQVEHGRIRVLSTDLLAERGRRPYTAARN